MNLQIIHIILEVLVFCVIFFYISKNFKTYKNIIEEQFQKIEELEEKIEVIEQKLSLIFNIPTVQKNKNLPKITEEEEEIEHPKNQIFEEEKENFKKEENLEEEKIDIEKKYGDILDRILSKDDLKTEPKE